MKKYLLIAATVLFLNSCKKDQQENDFVGTEWSLSKGAFLAENTCDYNVSSKDFDFELDTIIDNKFEFPSLRQYSINDGYFGEPVKDTLPYTKPIGKLRFSSISELSVTSQKWICEGDNYLNRKCTQHLVTTIGKYSIKSDSITFIIDNITKKGKFLSKDSLVVFTCSPLSYENPISTSSKPPYGWLLLGELYVRNK